GVGRGAGKAREHAVVVKLAHLARRALDDDVAQRDLPVAADGDLNAGGRLAPHANNGGAVKRFHMRHLGLHRPAARGVGRMRVKPDETTARPGRARCQSLRSTTLAYSVMPTTWKKAEIRRCTSTNCTRRPSAWWPVTQLSSVPAAEKSTRTRLRHDRMSTSAPARRCSSMSMVFCASPRISPESSTRPRWLTVWPGAESRIDSPDSVEGTASITDSPSTDCSPS